jgi:hypothetical protein
VQQFCLATGISEISTCVNCTEVFVYAVNKKYIHRLIDKKGLLPSGVTSSGRKETFARAFISQCSVVYSCLVSVQCSKPL